MTQKSVIAIFFLAVVLLAGLGFYYEQPLPSAPSASSQAEIASAPSACNVGFYVSSVAEDATGNVSYGCTADNTAEVSSAPAACATHFIVNQVAESAAGVISYNCIQLSAGDITGLSQETASSPSACGAGEAIYQVTESAGGVLTLTCQDVVNLSFTSNANTCSDTTSGGTGHMMGFSVTFTTGAANMEHDVSVTLNWKITAPTAVTVNTQYQLSYGSTSTPTCNAAKTGTQVGNIYTFDNPVAATTAAQTDYSLTVGILGLTASTTYWVDLNVIDSSTASWTYSLPQLTVTEN